VQDLGDRAYSTTSPTGSLLKGGTIIVIASTHSVADEEVLARWLISLFKL
jgi:hypothetical protein